MTRTRKLAALALSILMVLLAGTVALADPATGSITVADPNTQAVYDAYKIFDAEVDANNNVVYKIASDSDWYDVLFDEDGSSLFPSLERDGNASPYTVKKLTGFSSEAFANYLKAHVADKTVTSSVNGNADSVTMDDLAPGYYLVTTTRGGNLQANAALTNVLEGEDVTIQDKNDIPFDKTVDDVKEKPVEIGQTLHFKIVGEVPIVAANETSFTYLITDKMDDGLTFDEGSLTVTIGTGDDARNITDVLTEVTNFATPLSEDQIRYGANGKTFEISLDMLTHGKDTDLQGKPITVEYTATVNEDAAATISVNTAILEYGNDPQHLISKDSQTAVYTAKIVIDKYETGAPEQKVKGAKFVLSRDNNGTTEYYKATLDQANNKVTDVEWITDRAQASVRETDTDGRCEFRGLNAGDYQLTEVEAPAGYTLLPAPVDVTVHTEGVTDVSLTSEQVSILLTNTVHINNTPGSMMPSTGGIGRTIFFVLAAIVAADVIFHVVRRRNATEEE